VSGKTAGQQLREAYTAAVLGPGGEPATWEAAAAAVETGQLRLAREDRDSLRKRVLDLATKWDATADRNQRNGQSLINQGDEYGNEGLAVAEALGACVIELRHAAEPPS
jgi:hypothetical protein